MKNKQKGKEAKDVEFKEALLLVLALKFLVFMQQAVAAVRTEQEGTDHQKPWDPRLLEEYHSLHEG